MGWTDLSGEYNFGDRVPAIEIMQLHDNFTAVCSGEATTPKFKNKALAHGPAIGKNAPKTTVNSEARFDLQFDLGVPINVGSLSFFPSIITEIPNTVSSHHFSFCMAFSAGSISVITYTITNSTNGTYKAARNLEY